MTTVGALVVAAGRGERLGPGEPKALRLVGGAPLLVHAVRALAAAATVEHVVVAAPPDLVEVTRTLLAGEHAGASLEVVAGGAERPDSVRAALAALPAEVDVVLVHDAARPLAPSHLVDEVATAVDGGWDAVVPVLPVVDTVKQVSGDTVVATVDRRSLRSVQTPQGFRRGVLEQAHREHPAGGAVEVTDDAGMVERLGIDVHVVPGHEEAFKVTRPVDLLLAEVVLSSRGGA
ncbi:MAG TPA: 2-C-methyl-D-erythritol 4-phosphate cytidylyltransferase [Actinomycetes bacterium]|nr:2-C-methyl-D-erythritol 4-phosphate cytidylyltransferase [Actinomycetes bacterium]